MDLSVESRSLHHTLDLARRAVPSAPTLAAYTGVLLQIQGGFLLATGSDGETTVTAKLAVDVATPGQALVVPGPVLGYLEKLDPGRARLWIDESTDLCVSVGGRDPYRFRQLGATFPAPRIERAGLVPAQLGDLRSALAAVRHAADGLVQLRSDDHQVILSATDRYRIAQAFLPGAGFGEFTGVVPLAALDHLGREPIEQIGLDSRGRQLRARGPELFLTTRLIDEPFPDVTPIVAEPRAHKVSLLRHPLLEALDRLSTVSSRRTVSIKISSGYLEISAANVELGSGAETIRVEGYCDEFACHVNAGFLRDAVAAHVADRLELGWNGALQPLHLRSVGDLVVCTVVMPIQAG